ncbi:FeoA family protein [Peptoniphilus sp. oral taxon 386]|nr:FeoA family protein [Peptoniphilus sp. oral taxon 386]
MVPKNIDFKIVKIREKKIKRLNYERHLINLGFVEGAKISVVSETNGNLIVKLKDSRVAIGNDIAMAIMVEEIKE